MKKIEKRLRVLELVSEIASEAAQNPNIVWQIEFQELLVERLYRKMIGLLEEDSHAVDSDAEAKEDEEEEEENEEEEEEGDKEEEKEPEGEEAEDEGEEGKDEEKDKDKKDK